MSAELAAVAVLFGALDARLRLAPPGWRHRLALLEAAELSWWTGDRITAERLALWEALRLPGPQDDAQALARATWAFRRLAGGPRPLDYGGGAQDLADFLDRQGPDGSVPEDVIDLASLAEKITGANRATVQRNLVMMQDRGLIREVTGQGRYRVWTATI